MDAILIGPLALPAGTVVALITFSAAVLASLWWQWRGKPVEKWLWLITLSALAGARLAFVLRYPEQYSGLLAMLDIRDGGWWWPGALAALPVAILSLWRRPALRLALLSSAAVALMALAISLATLRAMTPEPVPMPDITLENLQGTPIPLTQVAQGPTLINLWATWCPPCRREMPVLASAQSRYPNVRFVLANQGETASAVRDYLIQADLHFDLPLLDPSMALGQHAGNGGLPLTLLLDGYGNELARHFGPLSRASLHHLLTTHLDDPRP
ncbi:MAG: TlpA disulfide reductase family protein [Alcanivorax sp.]|uniref:TlpA family protein disulfide reductase n=1 Tax=Alcanivorax sp. TaxID=1872427 RepID=UPI0032D8C104